MTSLLSAGQKLMAQYQSYTNAPTEITELQVRIEGQWLRIETSLKFMNSVWSDIEPVHQKHLIKVIHILQFKLQTAISNVSSLLEGAQSPDGMRKGKKLKYAVLMKESLHGDVTELENWQKLFEPSFFLISRIQAPSVDAKLDTVISATVIARPNQVPQNNQVTVMRSLRQAIKSSGSPDELLRGIRGLQMAPHDLTGQRIPIYYSSAQSAIDARTNRNVVVNALGKTPRQDPREFAQGVYELVRVLSESDPMMFGMLACRGFIPHVRGPGGTVDQFDLVFDFPGKLSHPQALRSLLNEAVYRGDGGEGAHHLGERIRVAKQLARSVMFVHACHLVHKNIRPECVLVFIEPTPGGDVLGSPFLVGFERFRRSDAMTVMANDWHDVRWHRGLYHHPERQGQEPEREYNIGHDMYSLGVCLLEIGLWTSFVVRRDHDNVPGPILEQEGFGHLLGITNSRDRAQKIKDLLVDMATRRLPPRVGKKYMEVVVTCLNGIEPEEEGYTPGGQHRPPSPLPPSGVWGGGGRSGAKTGLMYLEKVRHRSGVWEVRS